jgi:hypothetical protein
VGAFSKESAMWVIELIQNMGHSSPQGFVGVSLIFIYFAVMMWAIVFRIKKGDHMSH